MSETKHNNNEAYSSRMKKCPECFTYLPIDAEVCVSCKIKVGKLGKHGLAQKPVDWLSYVRCLSMWVIFGLYMWWVFLRDK